MMKDQGGWASRRGVLIGATLLGALPVLGAATASRAAGGVAKANAHYQDHPNGANRCGKCNYFLPGADFNGPGSCKVVAGSISPTGWCTLFAPRRG
jgi:hypothetical protein